MLKAYFHLVIPESKEVINVFIKETEITKTEITKNKTTKTFKQTNNNSNKNLLKKIDQKNLYLQTCSKLNNKN